MLSTTEDSLRILFNRKGNNDVERVKKTKVTERDREKGKREINI